MVGGLCELAGLGLVVREIARDREQARRLFVAKRRGRPPKRSYPPHQSPRPRFGFPSAVYRQAHQLSQIVDWVGRIDAAAYNNFIDMRKALDAQLDGAVDALRSEAADADDELRGHLRYVLAESARERVIGAWLLGIGIALAGAGSVIGTSSG